MKDGYETSVAALDDLRAEFENKIDELQEREKAEFLERDDVQERLKALAAIVGEAIERIMPIVNQLWEDVKRIFSESSDAIAALAEILQQAEKSEYKNQHRQSAHKTPPKVHIPKVHARTTPKKLKRWRQSVYGKYYKAVKNHE